jgi:hypothetical protein
MSQCPEVQEKDSTFLGSANNAIVTQETAKQIKSNAIYRYKRWGCKPKLNLGRINISYSSNTATYATRGSEKSARINPQPIVYQSFVEARNLTRILSANFWSFRTTEVYTFQDFI